MKDVNPLLVSTFQDLFNNLKKACSFRACPKNPRYYGIPISKNNSLFGVSATHLLFAHSHTCENIHKS